MSVSWYCTSAYCKKYLISEGRDQCAVSFLKSLSCRFSQKRKKSVRVKKSSSELKNYDLMYVRYKRQRCQSDAREISYYILSTLKSSLKIHQNTRSFLYYLMVKAPVFHLITYKNAVNQKINLGRQVFLYISILNIYTYKSFNYNF